MMLAIYITAYFLTQIAAHLIFRWGGITPGMYWYGFVLGNIFGISSMLPYIFMFRMLTPAQAVAIGSGGTFLLLQIFMYLVFRQPLNLISTLGIGVIFFGILIVAFGAPQVN